MHFMHLLWYQRSGTKIIWEEFDMSDQRIYRRKCHSNSPHNERRSSNLSINRAQSLLPRQESCHQSKCLGYTSCPMSDDDDDINATETGEVVLVSTALPASQSAQLDTEASTATVDHALSNFLEVSSGGSSRANEVSSGGLSRANAELQSTGMVTVHKETLERLVQKAECTAHWGKKYHNLFGYVELLFQELGDDPSHPLKAECRGRIGGKAVLIFADNAEMFSDNNGKLAKGGKEGGSVSQVLPVHATDGTVCPHCRKKLGTCPSVSSGGCKCVFHLHCLSQWAGQGKACPECHTPFSAALMQYFGSQPDKAPVQDARTHVDRSATDVRRDTRMNHAPSSAQTHDLWRTSHRVNEQALTFTLPGPIVSQFPIPPQSGPDGIPGITFSKEMPPRQRKRALVDPATSPRMSSKGTHEGSHRQDTQDPTAPSADEDSMGKSDADEIPGVQHISGAVRSPMHEESLDLVFAGKDAGNCCSTHQLRSFTETWLLPSQLLYT